MLAHPGMLAAFNAWANRRLYAACTELTPAQISQNRGAFFESIIGTLNHILLVDILYRERLEGMATRFTALNEILYADFASLSGHQVAEDRRWIALAKDIGDLDETIGFWTLSDNPERWEVPRHIYFTNLCQHQTHHRGQVHTMISQAGIEPPAIGYIEFRIDADGSFVTTTAEE